MLSGEAERRGSTAVDAVPGGEGRADGYEAEQARLRIEGIFMQMPSALCLLRGPEHVVELANPAFIAMVGAHRAFIGRPLREAVPEVASQRLIELLDQVYSSGEPYTGTELPARVDGHASGVAGEVLFNFVCQPLRAAAGQ